MSLIKAKIRNPESENLADRHPAHLPLAAALRSETSPCDPTFADAKTLEPFLLLTHHASRITHLATSNQQPATMSTTPTRKALVALLDHFNISVQSFEALRNDSYEKHLAERSLSELETLYEALLKPAANYEKIQAQLPRWGQAHRFAGKLPSLVTLRTIKRRILADQALNDLTRQAEFLKALSQRLTGLPASKQTDVFDATLALMNEELLGARLDGQPLLKNLPAVDRIIKAASVQARIRQADKRNQLREEIQGGRLKLDREKFEHQKKAKPEPRPPADPEDEYEEDNSGMTEDEKSAALMQKVYGLKLP